MSWLVPPEGFEKDFFGQWFPQVKDQKLQDPLSPVTAQAVTGLVPAIDPELAQTIDVQDMRRLRVLAVWRNGAGGLF